MARTQKIDELIIRNTNGELLNMERILINAYALFVNTSMKPYLNMSNLSSRYKHKFVQGDELVKISMIYNSFRLYSKKLKHIDNCKNKNIYKYIVKYIAKNDTIDYNKMNYKVIASYAIKYNIISKDLFSIIDTDAKSIHRKILLHKAIIMCVNNSKRQALKAIKMELRELLEMTKVYDTNSTNHLKIETYDAYSKVRMMFK